MKTYVQEILESADERIDAVVEEVEKVIGQYSYKYRRLILYQF